MAILAVSVFSLEVEDLLPTMADSVAAYQKHIKFINFVFSAGFLEVLPKTTRGLLNRLRNNWMLLYILVSMLTYLYVLINEPVNLAELCGIIFTISALLQQTAKGINALCVSKAMKRLFDWNKCTNNPRYEPEFSRIIANRIASSDKWIGQLIKFSATLDVFAILTYIAQPILSQQFITPTPIKLGGQSEFSLTVFLTIYMLQVVHAYCSIIYIIGYDAIFILLISAISGRFKTITDILDTLNYEGTARDHDRDRRTLIKCHVMHLDGLKASKLLSQFFSFYGLFLLGSNLFVNCFLLVILQTIAFDVKSLLVLMASVFQVFFHCWLGQNLTVKAEMIRDSLMQLSWYDMNRENKRLFLIFMLGSAQEVQVSAGGYFNLNMTLFASVMKTGASISAVIQAV